MEKGANGNVCMMIGSHRGEMNKNKDGDKKRVGGKIGSRKEKKRKRNSLWGG